MHFKKICLKKRIIYYKFKQNYVINEIKRKYKSQIIEQIDKFIKIESRN